MTKKIIMSGCKSKLELLIKDFHDGWITEETYKHRLRLLKQDGFIGGDSLRSSITEEKE